MIGNHLPLFVVELKFALLDAPNHTGRQTTAAGARTVERRRAREPDDRVNKWKMMTETAEMKPHSCVIINKQKNIFQTNMM